MPDAETAALLRAVLDEVCAELAPFDMVTRERVAARLNDLVRSGPCSVDDLRQAGRDALIRVPTMWP
ncbi:hypothetical protein G8O24_14475 [Bradyrhizobium sp. INPA01-394B]|uniref:Uncharacterized protein n=1 Tax=Bradyrhizobium campsiandrae TaxID=1729892 RepID=A0ABR7UCB2_9BRAD|nr:hypothetical protein [Bradyrhizobium campsiandrae]MBC9878546.1 hypothetical protein [Bradyrhizobium campsiandrae]MBC9981216.1 hypothetical protein [Bradyrhizobium campsiandrae]